MTKVSMPALSTQVRCLVDGEITSLARAAFKEARREPHAILGVVIEPASGLTWWAQRGSPDGPPPADALVVTP